MLTILYVIGFIITLLGLTRYLVVRDTTLSGEQKMGAIMTAVTWPLVAMFGGVVLAMLILCFVGGKITDLSIWVTNKLFKR